MHQNEKNDCFYNRFGSSYGKPEFPKLSDYFSRDLDFYTGNDSWMFSKILKLDSSFLQQPINTSKNQTFINAKLIIDHTKVVNDAA